MISSTFFTRSPLRFGPALLVAAFAAPSACRSADDTSGSLIAVEMPFGSDAGGTPSGNDGGTCPTQREFLLVDPLNCGACGHDCLGGACVSGKCQAIVVGDSGRGGDWKLWNKALYWRNSENATGGVYSAVIRRIDLVTGEHSSLGRVIAPFVEDDESYQPDHAIEVLAVDDEGVYVSASTRTTPTVGEASLIVVPHTGETPRTVASGHVDDVAIGPSHVYFGRASDASGLGRTNVYAASRAGGGASELLATSPNPIRGLQVNDDYLYANTSSVDSPYGTDEIARVSLKGGSFTQMAKPGGYTRIIGFTSKEMFFAYSPKGSSDVHVMRSNLASGKQTAVFVSTHHAYDSEFLVDKSGTVYFIDENRGLMRVRNGATEPEVLAQYPALTLRFLVQDERALYFTLEGPTYGNPKLMKLAK